MFTGTSDAFFASCIDSDLFDVVYLDGLHTFRQTYRDLTNALRVCRHGVVLIDDVVPCDAASALSDRVVAEAEYRRLGLTRKATIWHGDVYRVVLCVALHHPDLTLRTIMGSGNPQTLVWRYVPGVEVSSADEASLDAIDRIDYSTTFQDGIPEVFMPTAEPEALAAAVRGAWG